MKKIMILNGSPRKNGKTASLIKAFIEGAESSGNEIVKFDVAHMDIHGCLGCMACESKPKDDPNNCAIKDDMNQIYGAIMDCDVIVLASPVFWWGPTSQLKAAVDRLEAIIGHAGLEFLRSKSTALLMTYMGGGSQALRSWYSIFSKVVGCEDLGTVISYGTEKLDDARKLGASIQ
ncbi:MAG: flavodoxin family protein [Oscillospiraceae bacterium]|nr:flavodoxin family protein [Oscillospiraceae bacterium]